MNYLNGRNLVLRSEELEKFLDRHLNTEDVKIRQRIYEWLRDNQYFLDNELFDFYFCVAQNIAAVEVLGGSGQEIIEAGTSLQKSAKICAKQIEENGKYLNQELEKMQVQLNNLDRELDNIRQNQEQISQSSVELIKKFNREQENLEAVSKGLIISVDSLLDKQRKLSIVMKWSKKYVYNSFITIIALIGWLIATLMLLT